MKVILSGSQTIKGKEIKNPKILYSKIFRRGICKHNDITLRKGCFSHIFNSTEKDFSGRWYDTNINNSNYTFDDSKLMISYIIPEFETWNGTKNKISSNVRVDIYLSKKGYDIVKNHINY